MATAEKESDWCKQSSGKATRIMLIILDPSCFSFFSRSEEAQTMRLFLFFGFTFFLFLVRKHAQPFFSNDKREWFGGRGCPWSSPRKPRKNIKKTEDSSRLYSAEVETYHMSKKLRPIGRTGTGSCRKSRSSQELENRTGNTARSVVCPHPVSWCVSQLPVMSWPTALG